MKLWLVSASLFTIGVLAGAQTNSSGAIHVDPEKVGESRGGAREGRQPGHQAGFARLRQSPRGGRSG